MHEALLTDDLPSLDDLIDRPAWMLDALCREHPEVNFFPERGQPSAPAKAVCARCLVRRECADYAGTAVTVHGIWGGLSSKQRKQVSRGDAGSSLAA